MFVTKPPLPLLVKEGKLAAANIKPEQSLYLGKIFTNTLLYLESCGVPLSVTFTIK